MLHKDRSAKLIALTFLINSPVFSQTAPVTPSTSFPDLPRVYSEGGDDGTGGSINIRGGAASSHESLRNPSQPLTYVGENVEMISDGSGTPRQTPNISDWAFAASAFKKNFRGTGGANDPRPKSGEIDAYVGSVRQDDGDAAVYLASALVVDHVNDIDPAHPEITRPGFVSMLEGNSSAVPFGSSTINQTIDIQLGSINTQRSDLSPPSSTPLMAGLHAAKLVGTGGYAVNVETAGEGAWEYGLRIVSGGQTQLLQKSSDASLMVSGALSASSANVTGTLSAATITAPVISATTKIDGPVWTSYPNLEVTSFTGPPSGAYGFARFGSVGKTGTVNINIHISSNGGASGAVQVTLPMAARAVTGYVHVLSGREDAMTGKMLQAKIDQNVVTIFNYDNSYPGGDGYTLLVTGSYEIP